MNAFNYGTDSRYTITHSPDPLPVTMQGVGGVAAGLAHAGLMIYGTYKVCEKVVPEHPVITTVAAVLGLFLLSQA